LLSQAAQAAEQITLAVVAQVVIVLTMVVLLLL
jgi:hypothetical protein